MSTIALPHVRVAIIAAFERSGMTQQALASKTGVHFVTINRFIHNDDESFSASVMDKLAGALGLEITAVPMKKVVDTL